MYYQQLSDKEIMEKRSTIMITYETIDLNDYTQIGEGGNGKTYVTSADSDEILKVNNARLSTWEGCLCQGIHWTGRPHSIRCTGRTLRRPRRHSPQRLPEVKLYREDFLRLLCT